MNGVHARIFLVGCDGKGWTRRALIVVRDARMEITVNQV